MKRGLKDPPRDGLISWILFDSMKRGLKDAQHQIPTQPTHLRSMKRGLKGSAQYLQLSAFHILNEKRIERSMAILPHVIEQGKSNSMKRGLKANSSF